MSDDPDKTTPRARKGGVELPDDWQEKFLRVLRRTAVVGRAAAEAQVSRSTAYEHRNRDPEFAARWDDVIENAIDDLERVCRRLAVKGARRGVYYKGERIDTYREYPTSLQIFLLKSYRPDKFGDHTEPTASLLDELLRPADRERLSEAQLPPGAIPSLPVDDTDGAGDKDSSEKGDDSG